MRNWHWGPDVAKPLPHAKLMSQLDCCSSDICSFEGSRTGCMHFAAGIFEKSGHENAEDVSTSGFSINYAA